MITLDDSDERHWVTDDEALQGYLGLDTPPAKERDGANLDPQQTLLPYERQLMADTFTQDVLFIVARGLGLERLFLNHLHLYNDARYTVLVLNAHEEDEHYFLDRLKEMNGAFPPKLLNHGVLAKDREMIYKTGGVQFITARVLMVDLLTERVPIDKVAGIVIYRAHEILTSYQSSFILRLFREKKGGSSGFIKAFTDDAVRIASYGLGQLQHLVERLYVKRVMLVPRFDSSVKECFGASSAKITELSLSLNQAHRKIRSALVDILNTCVRELRQCTHGLENNPGQEFVVPSSSLDPTQLESGLRGKTLLLSEKQERLLRDLRLLRILLRKIENLDPTSVWSFIKQIRGDKELMGNNSGWIFTPTAAAIFNGVESLCSSRDADGRPSISVPPKWYSLKALLEEISRKLVSADSESPVLIVASNEETCRQLIDLIKFGPDKYCWLLTKAFLSQTAGQVDAMGVQPQISSVWNPHHVTLYDDQVEETDRVKLVNQIRADQKKAGRDALKKRKKRRIGATVDPKQPKLVSFGIVRYSENRRSKRMKITGESRAIAVDEEDEVEMVPEGMHPEDPLTDFYSKHDTQRGDDDSDGSGDDEDAAANDNDDEEATGTRMEDWCSKCKALLVFLTLGNRYNLLNCLDHLKPAHILLYNVDLPTIRIIETFKANNRNHPLEVASLMYSQTTDEERYLSSIQREQSSFEALIREQGVLTVPQEYDVSREGASGLRRLALCRDSRLADRQPADSELRASIVVDMREFNSELPTVLYRRGIDLQPATLEVGDYVLSNEICVERKALDDLSQSLWSGRVFKQVEQTLRYYPKTVLLVESSEKYRQKKVISGGAFLGELSRRGRETRSLFTMLIRANPQMKVVWSMSPSHSAELFEEIKLDQPNADLEFVTSIRSDYLFIDDAPSGGDGNDGDDDFAPEKKGRIVSRSQHLLPQQLQAQRPDPILKRKLTLLPGLSVADVDRMMGYSSRSADPAPSNLNELVEYSAKQMTQILGNEKQAEGLAYFFNTDFRLVHM